MQEKTSKIGSVNTVLRRAESSHNQNNVFHRIDLSSIEVENGQPVMISIHKAGHGGDEPVDEYKADVYETEKAVTLKTPTIHKNDLQPGQPVRVDVFEIGAKGELSQPDDGEILDTVSAVADSSERDGLDARLYSHAVCEYLGVGKRELTFRNLRTGETATKAVSANGSGRSFTFPKDARDKISANPKDQIQIITNGENEVTLTRVVNLLKQIQRDVDELKGGENQDD